MNFDVLLKEFEEILETEVRAKCFYDHFIDQVEDEDIKKELLSIRGEEIEHIKLAEELVGLVDSG